jgi:AcrR family transcriptional regulator
MSSPKLKRLYTQIARAQGVHETERRIIESASALFAEKHYDDVTLADVARRAGVSTRTVLRRFENKGRLAQAFMEAAAQHNSAWRDTVPTGDPDAAVTMLIDMYELVGDTVIRYLGLEGTVQMVGEFVARGRELHRAWVARVFQPLLSRSSPRRDAQFALLMVATDVTVWKVLRRDQKLSKKNTLCAVRTLVDAALATPSFRT